MNETATLLSQRMATLRQVYRERLPQRMAVLEQFMRQCNGALTVEQLEAARLVAHSLAGSGGTYGFAEISRHARALEKEILEGRERYVYKLTAEAEALLKACQDALQHPAAEEVVALEASATTGKPTVLVADDDEAITLLVHQLLHHDAAIVTVADGTEALQWLQRHPVPALLTLDEVMPQMGGLSLLKALRDTKEGSHLPVLMLTASHDSFHIQQAGKYGVADFLPKPFAPEKLIAHVRALLPSDAAK